MITHRRFASHFVSVGFACAVALACTAKVREFGTTEAGVSNSGGTGGGNADASAGSGGTGGTGGTGGVAAGGTGGVAAGGTGGVAAGGMGGGPTDAGGDSADGPAQVCTPGEDFCQGNEVRRCQDGSASTLVKQCGVTEFCDDASMGCLTQVCTPATTQCASGEQPQVCAADGSAWVNAGAACSGKEPICQNGQCLCATGEKRCDPANPDQPQECNNTNAWVNDGEPCSSAVYSGCRDSDGRCLTTSILVPWQSGGYDRVHNMTNYPAIVQNVRIDKYEATVGQFRRFVEAVVNDGWQPDNGDGTHEHLNGGNGLVNSGSAGGNESGWDTVWNSFLATTRGDWDTNLIHSNASLAPYSTWTTAVGANEDKPINTLTWYEAYAYCIWDEGFLPSEAEWEWAARGGTQGRKYPWGATDPGTDPNLAVWGCYYPAGSLGSCTTMEGAGHIADVDEGPAVAGEAHWGHVHMSGNVWEWVLDWHAGDPPYSPAVCDSCANVRPALTERVHRGGDFFFSAQDMETGAHRQFRPEWRDPYGGVRCARAP